MAAAGGMPPPKTFADLAEAKGAMLKLLDVLLAHQDELQGLVKECGSDQQLKMTKLIPRLQAVIASPMQEAGFPPPPMGMMQGIMAFTAASALEGGGCIKDGMEMLKSAMTGNFPDSAKLNEIKAKLS